MNGKDSSTDHGRRPDLGAPDAVTAALRRLAKGEFTRCEVCGDEVDDRRLRVAPETSRCVRHRTVGTPGF